MHKVEQSILELIESNIRNIPDFPKKGIQFKDITPLLANRDTLELTSQLLARPFRQRAIDHVVGLESRGFLFGTNLAQDLHAGFIPIRKPNKLPHHTLEASFELEYGKDTVEIHKDSIKEGERIIIHDDLIATGGSASAATRLVNELGGVVVGYSFIIQLKDLVDHSKLDPNAEYYSLISY